MPKPATDIHPSKWITQGARSWIIFRTKCCGPVGVAGHLHQSSRRLQPSDQVWRLKLNTRNGVGAVVWGIRKGHPMQTRVRHASSWHGWNPLSRRAQTIQLNPSPTLSLLRTRPIEITTGSPRSMSERTYLVLEVRNGWRIPNGRVFQ